MSIYKRASGRYAVLVDLDSTGPRRRRSLGTFATKKEAEKAERDALSARDRGIDLSPRTVTIAELMSRYLKDCDTRLEGATMTRYRSLSEKMIVPRLGGMTLARVRPAHLSEWIADLRQGGGHKGKSLSPKTVRHACVLLNGALKWAIRMQLTGSNPLAAVGVPAVPRSRARALDADEIMAVLAAAAETRWGPFVAFAFATGMRRGEMCALSWKNVDLERGSALVAFSLTEARDGSKLKSTKTDRARTVPLSRVALEALRKQRAIQAADKLAAGGTYVDSGMVFADAKGAALSPLGATKAYGRIAETAGISSLRLHDARHSAATHMLVAGVDIRSVSGILGHASANTTLGTYAHLVADAQKGAVDVLGDRLERIVAGEKRSRK